MGESAEPRVASLSSGQTPKDMVAVVGLPLATMIGLVVVWELAVTAFKVPEYILVAPSAFLARTWESRALLWDNAFVTGTEILVGFFAATIFSIPLALVIASSRFVERAFYPLIVFFQLIPKIAIAPLFIVWFGFDLFPKVLMTFLLCFFPTLVASMTGFKSLDPRILYITRSMGAGRLQTFRFVRLPSALPYIFSGLRVSIVFAATGALVGEFVGANSGLGYLLLRATSYLDTSLIFACLVVLSVMGLVFSYAVTAVENLVMPWQKKEG
jgi:NitT/TauT family transport system permease protein